MVQDQAILAQLSISQWTARKTDKNVTAEVERSHAAHDAGKFNKALVSKALLDPYAKLTSRVRDYHYNITLPWEDAGARLLPAVLFMDYTTAMRKFKDESFVLIADIKAKYPVEVQAARNRLGTMYNPGDYPDPDTIGQRFGINLEFRPVPSAADFRVDVSNEARAELEESVKQSVSARQADAVKSLYARIREVVAKVNERLSDPKAIFKDSLITNVSDLTRVLKGLNITNDPKITSLCEHMERKLIVSPGVLRTNERHRAEVAESAREILAELDGC